MTAAVWQSRPLSASGQGRGFVFESSAMTRRFWFFFYFFPCLLAEGTG